MYEVSSLSKTISSLWETVSSTCVALWIHYMEGGRHYNLCCSESCHKIRVYIITQPPELCRVCYKGIMLWSVTIPFKNLIKYLFLLPLLPTDPVLSSLVLSSTCSSVKIPDTCPDPNHQLCHNNDIMALDSDPNPWLTSIPWLLTHPDLLTYYYQDCLLMIQCAY
jgi:hypothetical protein